jgi:hypothetical protein
MDFLTDRMIEKSYKFAVGAMAAVSKLQMALLFDACMNCVQEQTMALASCFLVQKLSFFFIYTSKHAHVRCSTTFLVTFQ